MIDPDLKDLWTPTGLLLGFQATLFKWRIERESEVGDKGRGGAESGHDRCEVPASSKAR
jgi:hypothetical protein